MMANVSIKNILRSVEIVFTDGTTIVVDNIISNNDVIVENNVISFKSEEIIDNKKYCMWKSYSLFNIISYTFKHEVQEMDVASQIWS